MSVNLSDTVSTRLRQVAETVVMPRFRALAAHESEFKSANEPVTIADREAEERISVSLSA